MLAFLSFSKQEAILQNYFGRQHKQPHRVVMLEAGFCFPPPLLDRQTFAEHRTNIMPLPSQHIYQCRHFCDTSKNEDYCFTRPQSRTLHFCAAYVFFTHIYDKGFAHTLLQNHGDKVW